MTTMKTVPVIDPTAAPAIAPLERLPGGVPELSVAGVDDPVLDDPVLDAVRELVYCVEEIHSCSTHPRN